MVVFSVAVIIAITATLVIGLTVLIAVGDVIFFGA